MSVTKDLLYHAVQLHKASGVPYREMLFFDNEVHTQPLKCHRQPDVFPLHLVRCAVPGTQQARTDLDVSVGRCGTSAMCLH